MANVVLTQTKNNKVNDLKKNGRSCVLRQCHEGYRCQNKGNMQR
jgi:hypothetical protein